ncbi:uncharacterized protein [Paramormyrops kingsleyae]|uniref:uncharacterized protein isoform X2 n=1 Tax=Paramormyrops kingsleyae TaxID=1676925 RepID=UPI000CD5FFEA|nr:uncharacterized protein LOC111860782 isoform X1 [Paramormyrops kingsleyae]
MRVPQNPTDIDNTEEPGGQRTMERWRFATEEAGRPGCETGPDSDARPVEQAGVTETDRPIKVKREELTSAPCKVPRFRYVDFPSLHQCIRQLAVPPLDSWLARCPPPRRPTGAAPVAAKDGVPNFKYVDYPSLHHCIQQLSVPPLKTWSSELAQPQGHDGRTRAGSGAVKRDWDGQAKSNTRTSCPVREPGVSEVSPPHQRQVDPPKARPLSGSDRRCTQKEGAELPAGSLDLKPRPPCLGSSRTVAEENQESGADSRCLGPGSSRMQGAAQSERGPHPDELAWATVPECVCPFCQKMFADPEELKVHQRQHRDKKLH